VLYSVNLQNARCNNKDVLQPVYVTNPSVRSLIDNKLYQ